MRKRPRTTHIQISPIHCRFKRRVGHRVPTLLGFLSGIWRGSPPADADIPTLVPRLTIGILMFVTRMIDALDS